MRTRPPLLVPTRAAGLPLARARIVLGVVAVSTLAAGLIGARAAWPAIDPSLAAGVLDGVRHGGRFGEVAADSYRQAGYPLTIAELPLPTLATLLGALPMVGAVALLAAAAAGGLFAWWRTLEQSVRSATGPAAGVALVLIGMAGAGRPGMVALPEAWAGLLIALSLARWRSGGAGEAIGWGLAAAALSKPALLWLGLMALADRHDRRALGGWALAAGIAALLWLAEAHALAAMAGPLDTTPAPPAGTGAQVALAVPLATAFAALGPALALALAALAFIGWVGWRDPRAPRAAAWIGVVTLALAATGREDETSWALLAAPLLPLGLLALPDLLRDLVGAATDRRRITVTRLVR